MEDIITNIERQISLTEQEKETVLASYTYQKYPAKKTLLKSGEICRYSTYVISGILRNYHIDENANEHTINFAPAGWWIADLFSFFTQEPGNTYIEVVENAEVMFQTREQQQALYDKVPIMERFARIQMENAVVANQRRVLNNLMLTAEERYHQFTKRFPTLVYNIPQKQIASYLGITPEFFSKMKKKLLYKND